MAAGRRDPPHEVVLGSETVGVLNRDSSLADATQTVTPCGIGLPGSLSELRGPLSGNTAVTRLDAPSRSRSRMSSRPVKFLFRVGTPPQITGTPRGGSPRAPSYVLPAYKLVISK